MKDPKTTQSISNICQQEHFVQFYQQDKLLLDNLKSFIGGGLLGGDGCVIIATKEHCEALEKLLVSSGVDTASAQQAEQYIVLDADETLAKFMVNDLPNKLLFEKVAEEVLGKAIQSGRTVRAFGEMVAQLWAADNQAAAILLEQLWNEVIRRYNLTLFCAYPLHYFGNNAHSSTLREISQLYSSAITPLAPTIKAAPGLATV